MAEEDVIRYIEYEAPGIGIIDNDVAAVICQNDVCDEWVKVDPDTNVVEDGIEVQSEEFDMEAGEPTGRTIVELSCSPECRNDHFSQL